MHQTVEHLCGVHRTHQGLRIQPNLPTDWPAVSVRRRFRDVDYQIDLQRDPKVQRMTVEVDGRAIDGNLLAPSNRSSACKVLVRLP
jgi:cellobionic acid phosphorylase